MNFKYFLLYFSACSIIFTLAENRMAYAQEFNFTPSIFISARDFSYTSGGNSTVQGNINSLGIGLTGIYDKFYIDLSAEKNPRPSEEATENLQDTRTVDFNRTDAGLTFGYAVNESISTFIGYKYGKTVIEALPPSKFVGEEISLEGRGFFIGAGGGWRVYDWGFFSFSAGYALMAARYEDLAIGDDSGKAAGTSLSVKWRAPITERWQYDVALVRHDYRYEDLDEFKSDITEEIYSIRLGFAYRF